MLLLLLARTSMQYPCLCHQIPTPKYWVTHVLERRAQGMRPGGSSGSVTRARRAGLLEVLRLSVVDDHVGQDRDELGPVAPG